MNVVLIRGGGDLATGAAIRLDRAGMRVLITEIAQPLAVRRTVSFAEAIYEGGIIVEGVLARRAADPHEAAAILLAGHIPVIVDPTASLPYAAAAIDIVALVDARMTKKPQPALAATSPFTVGLGPGFMPGESCHAVVETLRGHTLGRVYRIQPPHPNTSAPDGDPSRLLLAPADGVIVAHAKIGDQVQAGQLIAHIHKVGGVNDSVPLSRQVLAPLAGVLRGLIRPGLEVRVGMKIGDVDPRNDPAHCHLASDKALAVGGGVLEALLTRPDVRALLWN